MPDPSDPHSSDGESSNDVAGGSAHAPDGRSRGRFRRFRRRLLLTVGAVLICTFLLLLWTRATASTSFCSKCHVMDGAVATARESIHADVDCITCHVDSGAMGALRYVPSLVREVVQEATGWKSARGVLGAKPCMSCHESRKSRVSGDVAAGKRFVVHPDPASDCASCHGDVAHPGRPRPASKGHPDNYQQVHGRDVASEGRAKCATCHEVEFCRSCHVDDPAKHPADWMTTHGASVAASNNSCTMCHAPETFCKACHGTVIPHRPGWLARHPIEVDASNVQFCTTCHAQADCERCHDKHRAHREFPGAGA